MPRPTRSNIFRGFLEDFFLWRFTNTGQLAFSYCDNRMHDGANRWSLLLSGVQARFVEQRQGSTYMVFDELKERPLSEVGITCLPSIGHSAPRTLVCFPAHSPYCMRRRISSPCARATRCVSGGRATAGQMVGLGRCGSIHFCQDVSASHWHLGDTAATHNPQLKHLVKHSERKVLISD
jgi:hypothetical protein